ncbi:MAG: response regulator [Bdellovibrionaceae bacterium]|nr:response regulator [Pseudobdellovibrionaceae bacterium]
MFAPGTRVLVVDDMTTMRKVVMRSCKELGLAPMFEAADGNQAWNVLNEKSGEIDLIISDWNMPNCTGLEFLKRVRADARFKALPFVLLTAESEASQVKEALLAGVDNYVIKPFSTAVLGQKLGQVHKKLSA